MRQTPHFHMVYVLLQRGLRYVTLSVCLSVCYHVICHHAQQDDKSAVPKVSALHWLDFKSGDFRI